MTPQELVICAKDAAKYSYAPFSKFNVGAALITESGKVYTGCNIENSSYSATVCAERVAFYKAISEGETQFKEIAIVGGNNKDFSEFCPPCGVCRQVMSQFCSKDFLIHLGGDFDDIKTFSLNQLLPETFAL